MRGGDCYGTFNRRPQQRQQKSFFRRAFCRQPEQWGSSCGPQRVIGLGASSFNGQQRREQTIQQTFTEFETGRFFLQASSGQLRTEFRDRFWCRVYRGQQFFEQEGQR